jgi:hypothetical protein
MATPPRANLSREEPDAGNLDVRVCECGMYCGAATVPIAGQSRRGSKVRNRLLTGFRRGRLGGNDKRIMAGRDQPATHLLALGLSHLRDRRSLRGHADYLGVGNGHRVSVPDLRLAVI